MPRSASVSSRARPAARGAARPAARGAAGRGSKRARSKLDALGAHLAAVDPSVAPKAPVVAPPDLDPKAAASAAGLRYVRDDTPGITRRSRGDSFVYYDADGKRVRDAEQISRIRALAIPPAWTEVWICPHARGHIQATGRDARGRKQYRYHAAWRRVRDETKFGRMIEFGEALPAIRKRALADTKRPGLPREKVLGTVVMLLDATLIRVGNAEYADTNGSYGLTTLRDKHVAIRGPELRFSFKGKSGKEHQVSIEDKRLARIVKACREVPGYELFQYIDDDGERRTVSSEDVNDYIRDVSGKDFTAKDFRTWAATVLAMCCLVSRGPARSQRASNRVIVEAVKEVSLSLGNTPAVCRKSYIHPGVLDAYADGTLARVCALRSVEQTRKVTASLRPEEKAVLRLLRRLERAARRPQRKSA